MNKHYAIAFKSDVKPFVYTGATHEEFYTKPMSILCPPTHIQYHIQSFFIVKKINTIT